MITSAESVAFFLLAVGAFVQFALIWPFLPQRKQIGGGLPLFQSLLNRQVDQDVPTVVVCCLLPLTLLFDFALGRG